jgi:hypothetical protein
MDMEASLNAMDTLAENLQSSLDGADKLYFPGEDAKAPISEINTPGVPLGNFEKQKSMTTIVLAIMSASPIQTRPSTNANQNTHE